jgi:hypothetical protein
MFAHLAAAVLLIFPAALLLDGTDRPRWTC